MATLEHPEEFAGLAILDYIANSICVATLFYLLPSRETEIGVAVTIVSLDIKEELTLVLCIQGPAQWRAS